ncbi:MAG: hypothetical protein ACRDH2_14155, partial [Anaerolineales bacterium]
IQMGETPQSIVETVLPRLTLAQVHDALSYYYDHQDEIDQERAANSEAAAQARLRERLGEEGYRRLTGAALFSAASLNQMTEHLATSGSAESNTIEVSPILE